jgi:hypothetical protein
MYYIIILVGTKTTVKSIIIPRSFTGSLSHKNLND